MASACATTLYQPPPASLFTGDNASMLAKLHPSLKSPTVDILYATDRLSNKNEQVSPAYGYQRSYSLTYGLATVSFGKDMSWEDLEAWTVSAPGSNRRPAPRIDRVSEIGRLPDTPMPYTVGPDGVIRFDDEAVELKDAAWADTYLELCRQLALSGRKELFVFVHGVNTTFEEAVLSAAMAWHQLGRTGVPIVYTWPSGNPGVVFYTADRESGEFTIFHLKEMLRALAAVDEVEKIHLLAHSRGTDVVGTAVRELVIEARGAAGNTRASLKIGNVVLLAPDLDYDVFTQRYAAENLVPTVDRVSIYANKKDTAIGAAKSLFSSRVRIGQLSVDTISERDKAFLDRFQRVDLIFYQGSRGGSLGHSYYRDPEVLADLFLLLVERRLPGAQNGRPLTFVHDHLWVLPQDYMR
jgi:esterase/lipase superfamily enzyme